MRLARGVSDGCKLDGYLALTARLPLWNVARQRPQFFLRRSFIGCHRLGARPTLAGTVGSKPHDLAVLDNLPLSSELCRSRSRSRYRMVSGSLDATAVETICPHERNGMNAVRRNAAARKQRMPDFPSPLPLAAFEEYMLWDDRPSYPMSIIARLRFAGQLDRRATAEALETVVARHPLLRAKIRKTPAGRLEWIAAADRPPAISWIDGPAARSLALDAADRPFFRTGIEGLGHSGFATEFARVASTPRCLRRQGACSKSSTTSCEAMPALSDRQGALRSNCRPATPQALRGRGTFWSDRSGSVCGCCPRSLAGLSGVWQFLMRRPVPLLARSRRHFPANCRRAFRT